MLEDIGRNRADQFVLGRLFWNCELEPTPHRPSFKLTESVMLRVFQVNRLSFSGTLFLPKTERSGTN